MSRTEYSFDGLDRMERELGRMIEQKFPEEFKRMVLQVAQEVLIETKEKTPQDTSRLLDGWKLGRIKKIGNEYVIEIYNNVEYAEFVEEGHRLRNGAFKDGVHMLELSLEEVNDRLPAHLQRWINNFIATHNL